MPAKPGLRLRLITITSWASSTSMIGMPGDRRVGVVLGGRVGDVVGADHHRDVGLRHLGVDLVHLLELLVGDVGLGEQDVHVAGHPARDRVDRVVDVDAALLELVGELLDRVLGLGDRHAVAGDDDDRVGVAELDRGVLGRRSSVTGAPPSPPPPRSARRRSRRTGGWRSSGSSPSAISSVRIVPEEPTSVPATIRTTLSRAKPAAAAARPVKALSSEITTGMSAPPIGSTKRLPSTRRGDQDADVEALRRGVVVDAEDDAAGEDRRRAAAR